jgi:hypothetical protein
MELGWNTANQNRQQITLPTFMFVISDKQCKFHINKTYLEIPYWISKYIKAVLLFEFIIFQFRFKLLFNCKIKYILGLSNLLHWCNVLFEFYFEPNLSILFFFVFTSYYLNETFICCFVRNFLSSRLLVRRKQICMWDYKKKITKIKGKIPWPFLFPPPFFFVFDAFTLSFLCLL